jgi:hypothetical protein
MSFSLPTIGLALIFSIAMCVHVVRTGRELFWLWIILLVAPPIGGLVYFIAIVMPSLMGGPAARRASQVARETLDPGRDYRDAKAALAESPTVHNRMRLAEAAGELGRWDEAEALYRESAQGVHAEDPALRFGLANALVQLGRHADALPILDRLQAEGDAGRESQIALLFARSYEGLGRIAEAEKAFKAAQSLPGLEGIARYGAFLARTGRTGEAREILAEIDARLARVNSRFLKEGRAWRDLAAREIG